MTQQQSITVRDLQKAVEQLRKWIGVIDTVVSSLDPDLEVQVTDPDVSAKIHIEGKRCLALQPSDKS